MRELPIRSWPGIPALLLLIALLLADGWWLVTAIQAVAAP
jgi:hypothetical protein